MDTLTCSTGFEGWREVQLLPLKHMTDLCLSSQHDHLVNVIAGCAIAERHTCANPQQTVALWGVVASMHDAPGTWEQCLQGYGVLNKANSIC